MVGQSTATTKPSRSDELPDPDEQVEITNRVRSQFDSLAPKRPSKPNRSEPDPTVSLPPSDHYNIEIPELDRLRSLQSQSHGKDLGVADHVVVQDEFMETEYYEKLAAIDKQHYTTGSGFIRVVKGEGEIKGDVDAETMTVAKASGDGSFYGGDKAVFKSNPATNDWVPAMEDQQAFLSSKPNRSESS